MIKVLLTAVGSNTSISVLKALRREDRTKYYIVGVDHFNNYEAAGSSYCDKTYRVPPVSSREYVKQLLNICVAEDIQVLIPIIDLEVEKIARNKALFVENKIIPCVADYKNVKICNDKYLTYNFLKNKGIKVPQTLIKKDLNSIGSNLKKTFFVKPRRGCSSIDCFKANNHKELMVYINIVKDPVIQEFLDGKKYIIDVINNLKGENILAIPREEFSAKAGIGVRAQTIRDEGLIEYGKKVAETLNIKGTANIEVFRKNNKILFIEINPRFSAGSILSVVAGVNIAKIVIDIFLDKKIERKDLVWEENVYMTRYWQEFFYSNKKLINL